MLRCKMTHIPKYASSFRALPQNEFWEREISFYDGVIAQLGERLPCTQEVCGSIPHSSTIFYCSNNTSECTGDGVLRSICSLKIRNKLKIETTHGFLSPKQERKCGVSESLKFSQSRLCLTRHLRVVRLSDQAYTVDALAVRGDEGRANLR